MGYDFLVVDWSSAVHFQVNPAVRPEFGFLYRQRFYLILLFPVAKPTALLPDRFLGPDAIAYFKEKAIRQLIKLHMAASESDFEKVEGQGALNFLELDDVPLAAEGEPAHPGGIVPLPFDKGKPLFPPMAGGTFDALLKRIHECGKKWIVLVDPDNEPRMVLNSDEFIRDALFNCEGFNPYRHCHRPVIITNDRTSIGDVLSSLKFKREHSQDDVADHDVILLWAGIKRIVTGAGVLGRILRNIVQHPVLAPEMAGHL